MVGEAADGAEAVALARAQRPDVVLMDIRMPALDGLEATRRIVAEPALRARRVLVLTTFELDEYVFERAARRGRGLPAQGRRPARPAARRRVVAAGESLLAAAVTRRVIEAFARARAHRPRASAGSTSSPSARRDRRARRHRPVQRRDRRAPGHQPRHRAHPCLARDAQARRARPRAARRLRLRGRARDARSRGDVDRPRRTTPDLRTPRSRRAPDDRRPGAAASWS